jgi:hypothetical protein
MGLDMYAWAVKPEDVIDDFSFMAEHKDGEHNYTELFYWRKHHDLHGWMENLYRGMGGTKESFNCAPVRLYTDTLDALEKDIKFDRLPKTTGFFFGDNPPDAESIERDLRFIRMARTKIAEGFAVYYDSWW